jgi:RNA polymerase sigma-70 factor (ECF subfamily)
VTGDARLAATFVRTRAEADFRALYRAATPPAFGLALRLTGGDEDEAEDVVQEAWVRAVERLDRFRAGEPFGPWLRGFVVNCWRERQRAARRAAEVGLDDEVALAAADAGEPRSAEDPVVDPDALRRAVAALPGGFREVLVLHDVEGCTHAEIAALLEISEGTSKSQLARARGRLRRALGAAGTAPHRTASNQEGPDAS